MDLHNFGIKELAYEITIFLDSNASKLNRFKRFAWKDFSKIRKTDLCDFKTNWIIILSIISLSTGVSTSRE